MGLITHQIYKGHFQLYIQEVPSTCLFNMSKIAYKNVNKVKEMNKKTQLSNIHV